VRFFDEPFTAEERAVISESFDHNGQIFRKNPFEAYALLRHRCPVAHSDAQGGFWVPTTYEQVTAIAGDDETFSSKIVTIPQWPETFLPPITCDPPESGAFRQMLLPVFSPAAVRAMRPRIEALATAAIDAFIGRGEADLVQDYARRVTYPNAVAMAGLPIENAFEIMRIVAGGVLGTIEADEYLQGNAFVHEQVAQAIADQRLQPKDHGVISHMLHKAKLADGRQPTEQEIEGAVMLVLGGGADTTVAATGTTLYYLGENPEVRARLLAGPALWDTALEEFLRFTTPAQALARIAAKDCQIGGKDIRKGDLVLLPWAAGNWDEAEFAGADQIVLDRSPNRHLAFGVGSHRCIGSHVARAMLDIMLRQVLTRLPDYQVVREGVRKAPNASVVLAFTHLPVSF
jgi:cytochrome P450